MRRKTRTYTDSPTQSGPCRSDEMRNASGVPQCDGGVAPGRQRRRGAGSRGFALVITLVLMVLLTLLAVGLLSLSAVSMRGSSQSQAMSAAQANARLGMLLALGDLQSTLGPDRRVSASAAAVFKSPRQPHLTGAWESWHWDPAKSPSPDYAEKAELFRRWLVSAPTPEDAKTFGLPASDPAGDSVELVRATGNEDASDSVRATKVNITNPKSNDPTANGAVAWAVFDESAKASIDLGDPEKKPDKGEEIASRNAPVRVRADSLDPALASLKTPKNIISLETAVIPGGPESAPVFHKHFHDFTTASLGLLTDTANGGLKTDLTSLFEASPFPYAAFTVETPYSTAAAGAPRWMYLYDHYRKYKSLKTGTAGTPTYTVPPADLVVSSTGGLDASPKAERLLPVIAKMNIVFSIVSHHAHLSDRVNFLDTQGVPKGNHNHAVPHFVYEPVVTLFNPYDVALDLTKLRIRVWDPPVGFRFQKIINGNTAGGWYRQEMEAGEFHGLARLCIANEHNTTARRTFTLILTDGTSQAAGNSLRLQPGEVKVFSSRVESAWNWALETAGGYAERVFFDWNAGANFGNIDNRTGNQKGVEAVPGWDLRAGIQTDHMSYSGGRPDSTFYDFERLPGGPGGGFISVRLTDQIKVEMKPQRNTGGDTTVPDFQVDVLAGVNDDVTKDILRSYRFRFADVVAEVSANPSKPVISRTYLVSDTMQEPNDMSLGGKKCIGMLEMTARTTKDPLDDSKAWIYNNPVVEGGEQVTSAIGAANQSYDVRLMELTGWSSFPIIEWDSTKGPGYGRGYFGASRSSTEGVTNVPMDRVPVAPAASLGELIPGNLVAGAVAPRVVHPFGNSWAHPLLPAAQVSRRIAAATVLDHSYYLNDTLWDRYYFSSATAYQGGVLTAPRSRTKVLEGMLDGSTPAVNGRLVAATPPGDATELAGKLNGLNDIQRAQKLAATFAVKGPFNLNSTSVDSWRAVLASLRDREVTAWKNRVTTNAEASPFVRMGLPLAGPKDTSADVNVLGQIRWAGYRNLTDSQIETLAKAIVEEITKRGIRDKAPPLTIGEFVNRRLGPASDVHSLAGILQTAIDKSGLNNASHAKDSKTINVSNLKPSRKVGAVTLEAMNGYTGEGAPSMITQGDLMESLASVATVRGDTFKIRAYGQVTSSKGVVEARAWCEAVVQRVPEFIDPTDAPETAVASLTRTANKSFGRRFQIVSFRWLKPEEA